MPDAAFSSLWSLDPTIRYLNHGSFGATPRRVLDHQAALRIEMEREPVRFLWRELPDRLDEAREALADFLGANATDLVFVGNATEAVNAVIRSLDWKSGDEILTTDHAYNACRNVLDHVVQHDGARVTTAAIPFPLSSEDQIVEAIVSSISPRTRLAMIDHVTSPTALVLPIQRIVTELLERGIETLVDGAHGPGMLPLELDALGAAYYTGNLHKWVCAPKGAAFLHTRSDRQDRLLPSVISHGLNTPREGSTPYHDLFDWPGTFDPTPWLSVPEAITTMGSLLPGGWDELRRRNHQKALDARAKFCNRLDIEAPAPVTMLGSMVTLPLPGKAHTALLEKPDPLQRYLYDHHRIEVPIAHHAGRRWFRISAQIYNSADDYEALIEALAQEA